MLAGFNAKIRQNLLTEKYIVAGNYEIINNFETKKFQNMICWKLNN